MTKAEELRDPTSCLSKAAPDEPIFIIRAKDPLAGQIVRLWAAMAVGVHEPGKTAEATEHAARMEKWRSQAFPAPGIDSPTGRLLVPTQDKRPW